MRLFGSFLLGISLFCTAYILSSAEDTEDREFPLQMIVVSSRVEAEAILRHLETGKSFEELAKEYSVDAAGPAGGYLGMVKLSTLRPEVREALESMGSSQVTEIVQTPSGYMILKVLTEAERLEMEAGPIQKHQLAIAGGHRIATQVGGFGTVDTFFKRLNKPPAFYLDLPTVCETKLKALEIGIGRVQQFLADRATEELGSRERMGLIDLYEWQGQLSAYQGDLEEALKYFQKGYELSVAHDLQDLQLLFEEMIGATYLRRGQIEHCTTNHNPRCCLLPLGPEGRHTRGSNDENAIKHFLRFLEQKPDDLEVKWLLNIAYMALGKYPQDVPEKHLIPPAAFESAEDIGRFEDVAPSLGLDVFNMAGGAIMDDFDNDGFFDTVISSYGNCDPMHYFRNQGDGTFADRTREAGLADQLGGLNLIQTDYNNDGWLDIYVLRGAWELPMRNSLLKNNGGGTFTDVTREAGLAVPATATQTAAWADFDNDGHIDLFVGNEFGRSQLFHNNGDGTFTDVAYRAGVDRVAFTKGVAARDYDNDGYVDYYVSNWGEENFLYHNNGNGTFTDLARQLQVEKPIDSFPVWFFDYDNDGWEDLFVSSFVISLVAVVRSHLKLPTQAETQKLYKNVDGRSFQDVTGKVGLDRVLMPMGANFGDVDNDGFLDFYLGTGTPSFVALVPNILFRNHDGKYFVDISTSSGTGHLGKGHAIAFGDFDNDGDQDIFEEVGGAVPGDRYANVLFRNSGHRNNWISLRLEGVKTNRAAIGARIKVTVIGHDQARRSIHRVVSSGGSFGASPLQQHIGLGKARHIEALEIWWPTSNTRQTFHNVAPNQFLEIREFAKDFVKLERRALPSLKVQPKPKDLAHAPG